MDPIWFVIVVVRCRWVAHRSILQLQWGLHRSLLYTSQREKRSFGLAIFQEGVERTLVNKQVSDPFLEDSELSISRQFFAVLKSSAAQLLPITNLLIRLHAKGQRKAICPSL